jgi:hypothetical protein
MMSQACNPSYSGGRVGESQSEDCPGSLSEKQTKSKSIGEVWLKWQREGTLA